MNISYQWLKRFLAVDLDANRVDELLTNTGLEVEGIHEVESIKGGLRGVVVGEVLTCEKHPNADRLRVTTVNIGEDEPVQIICGASNVAAGQKVPVATLGTRLYPGGEELKIKKGKIRGEVSLGMICAEDELGLGNDHDGIMVLDTSLKPGTPCAEVFNVEIDYVFEIGLTPNRTDAMGHIGVARDLRAALLVKGEESPELIFPKGTYQTEGNNPIKLTIESDMCPSYYGTYFTGVQVAESPDWLKNSLTAIGLTPKNNVVDITNYVLHTFGHPLHAFDSEKLNGHEVVVRQAKKGEKITTLDGVERELSTSDLVIADERKPVCIAGVLGGSDSGVSETTSCVYLESAYFDAVSVRKTAKRHAINSDASYRYERGVDPNITAAAHTYAAALICELTGATAGPLDHQGSKDFPKLEITFSFEKVCKLIGVGMSIETESDILKWLDFEIIGLNGDQWTVKVPTYRVDVTRDVDIAEELLRIYGFNNVAVPSEMRISVAKHDPRPRRIEKSLLDQLTGNGFFEIMNNSLSKGADYETLQSEVSENLIEMLNPLSQDLNVMRNNLLFGGLTAISFNQKRQQSSLRFFERGKTYGKGGNGSFETSVIDLFCSGTRNTDHWKVAASDNDFFYMKGLVEGLLSRFGFTASMTRKDHSLYGEFLSIKVGKTTVGHIGSVHPIVQNHFDVKGTVAHASFDWERVIHLVIDNGTQPFEALPKFPSVRRDLALLVDTTTTYAEVEETITKTEGKLLKNVFLFDVYEGNKLPSGKKSYAIGLTFQDPRKTLNDKAVEKSVGRIVHQLSERLNAQLR
ncbi:MAG TPA: phenylalanine--tRNA ligase subunit beta [Cryomorphaceae bacterium]|nr:phenylalanine--tRNA ligase subunit beta [Cryomorphaceae bacterium]